MWWPLEAEPRSTARASIVSGAVLFDFSNFCQKGGALLANAEAVKTFQSSKARPLHILISTRRRIAIYQDLGKKHVWLTSGGGSCRVRKGGW